MKNSKKIALTGMLCALGMVIMMMGGMIPLATFCCPALTGLVLIPIFVECGKKLSWGAYIAIALLSLMLCPDKEAAALFVFLGYYPILKWRLEQIKQQPLRILAKLGIFNGAIGLTYALLIFILRMDAIMNEYREMGVILTIACLILGNITLLVYDRLLVIMTVLYVRRLRGKLMK